MFSTSADILNFVLATSVIALTFFICMALFYVISSIRKTQQIIKAAENIVSKTNNLLGLAQDKIKSSSTYIMLLGELFKKVLDYFNNHKSRDSEESPSKKAEKKTKKEKEPKKKTEKSKVVEKKVKKTKTKKKK